MEALPLSLALATIFGWCLLSGRLGPAGLTAPIVFVACGYVLAEVFDLDLGGEPELVKAIAEVTLVMVLFGDASKVLFSDFRRDLGTYARLLGIGLPLTMGLGTAAAMVVLGFEPWPALLLGAALAPTDAALGATVMSNPRVPATVRRASTSRAGSTTASPPPSSSWPLPGLPRARGSRAWRARAGAVVELLVGVLAGVAIGGLGGMASGRARSWVAARGAGGPAILALALLAYTGALLVDGNGFVAAFVGGLVFGNVAGRGGEKEVHFVEASGALTSMISWLVFGALAVPVIGDQLSWTVILYVGLSLTLVRMLPVALALLGAGFDRYSVVFIGWFGPRGLASVIFALLALEDLEHVGQEIVAIISLTVLVSVIAHGVSAGPLANRFPSRRPVR